MPGRIQIYSPDELPHSPLFDHFENTILNTGIDITLTYTGAPYYEPLNLNEQIARIGHNEIWLSHPGGHLSLNRVVTSIMEASAIHDPPPPQKIQEASDALTMHSIEARTYPHAEYPTARVTTLQQPSGIRCIGEYVPGHTFFEGIPVGDIEQSQALLFVERIVAFYGALWKGRKF
jgi:hypothetical protein